MKINDLSLDDRPREKMMRLGASALSNAELLAILIGSGTVEESAVDLMQRVLTHCKNNLNTLGKLSQDELEQYKGIGPAKAICILAACELGRRRQTATQEERPKLNTSIAIYNYMRPRLQDLKVEEAWVLLLNQRYHLIAARRISHGGLTETTVDVRLVMREAILKGATIIAFCHNHPSGNASPSRQDNHLTQQLQDAATLLRIHFADHVIISDHGYYSYQDEGNL